MIHLSFSKLKQPHISDKFRTIYLSRNPRRTFKLLDEYYGKHFNELQRYLNSLEKSESPIPLTATRIREATRYASTEMNFTIPSPEPIFNVLDAIDYALLFTWYQALFSKFGK